MLRGIACLGVCFMHFTGTVNSQMLNNIGLYGGYGVPIFFAISGFIIPYSMNKSNYRLRNFLKFMAKRMIRLEPPYIASIIGVFLLSAVAQFSIFNSSEQIEILTANTYYHLFYLVEFAGEKWLNPVYWTLAIEFQFYLVCGFLFPILNFKNVKILVLSFLGLCTGSFLLTDDRIVVHYFLMFLPGIVLYWFFMKKISRNIFLSMCIIIGFTGAYLYGIAGPISALISICFILFINKPWKPLLFIGTISYSLYLIHTIVGTDGIINFMQNYITGTKGQIVLMILSFPIVIVISWLFHILIERPSKHFSKKIRYGNTK